MSDSRNSDEWKAEIQEAMTFAKTYPMAKEAVTRVRHALLLAYEHRDSLDVPGGLVAFESDWKNIEPSYEGVINRPDGSMNALRAFMDLMDSGFYPAPEILICLENAFSQYFNMGGDYSLDEAFFGAKHKKTKSEPYAKAKNRIFISFHVLYVCEIFEKFTESATLEDKAERFLSSNVGQIYGLGIDMDSFLRGYRRWKKDGYPGLIIG